MKEVRAAFLTLWWRARTPARIGSRLFHPLDSQVALGGLVKGRSSSSQLNRIVSRTNALTLAGSFYPAYGYVMSEWNPSDPPSRLWELGRGPSRATPRRARPRPRKNVAKAPITKSSARRAGAARNR